MKANARSGAHAEAPGWSSGGGQSAHDWWTQEVFPWGLPKLTSEPKTAKIDFGKSILGSEQSEQFCRPHFRLCNDFFETFRGFGVLGSVDGEGDPNSSLSYNNLSAACEGFIRHRTPPSNPPRPPLLRGRFGIEIGSNEEIDVESMLNRCGGGCVWAKRGQFVIPSFY